jgi:hypothetical protein
LWYTNGTPRAIASNGTVLNRDTSTPALVISWRNGLSATSRSNTLPRSAGCFDTSPAIPAAFRASRTDSNHSSRRSVSTWNVKFRLIRA